MDVTTGWEWCGRCEVSPCNFIDSAHPPEVSIIVLLGPCVEFRESGSEKHPSILHLLILLSLAWNQSSSILAKLTYRPYKGTMPDRATGQEERQEAPAAVQAPTRSLRGLPALRGSGSLRGGLGRGSTPSNASMVPSRSSYAVASGSATPGPKMQFRPVIPQRRKPSESPAPQAT